MPKQKVKKMEMKKTEKIGKNEKNEKMDFLEKKKNKIFTIERSYHTIRLRKR